MRCILALVLALFLTHHLPASPSHAAEASPKKKAKKTAATDERGLAVAEKNRDGRKRVALVIGNSGYRSSPLKNPANDARAMASTLRRLGFEVEEKSDLGYFEMNKSVESFGKKLRSGGVGLFYYAGHGMQVNGANYLIPVDARIEDENEVRFKAVDAGLVLAKMEQAKSDVNIVVLDACRDNPFSRSFRSSRHGLASMDAPNGTFIAYATAPGKTAADGDGRNGLYTAELVKVLETPGIPLEQVFKRTLRAVREKSGRKQTPWVASNLEGEFFFIQPSGMTDLQPSPVQPQPVEPPRKQLPGKPVVEEPAAPSAARGLTDPATGMEFVSVPGGCFQMGDTFGDGDSDEKPVHEVCVDGFSMGKYEVTNTQYRTFKPGHTSGEYKGNSLNGDSQPVVNVSWSEAVEFAQWLSRESGRTYRLPTEAEWEYAARGGTTGRNYWGNNKDDACGYANVHDRTSKSAFSEFTWENHNCDDGYKVSAPAGSFRPNAFGLYDMMGNAWEWTGDWFDKDYYGKSPRNNPEGPEGPSPYSFRVNRGGGWTDSDHGGVRAANRLGGGLDGRDSDLGFRLVLPSVR